MPDWLRRNSFLGHSGQMAAVSIFVLWTAAIVEAIIGPAVGDHAGSTAVRTKFFSDISLSTVVLFGPILETSAMYFLWRAVKLFLRDGALLLTFCVINGIIWWWLHGGLFLGIGPGLVFVVFAYGYGRLADCKSEFYGFGAVTLAHSLCNLVTYVTKNSWA